MVGLFSELVWNCVETVLELVCNIFGTGWDLLCDFFGTVMEITGICLELVRHTFLELINT